MLCLKRGSPLSHLLVVVFLDSGFWQCFRWAFCLQTERYEKDVIGSNDTGSYLVTKIPSFHREDLTDGTLPDASPLTTFEGHLTRANHTDSWKSVEMNQLTPDSIQHDYDRSTQVDEQRTVETLYEVREEQCISIELLQFVGRAGRVHGLFEELFLFSDFPPYCTFKIVVPEGEYVEATLNFTKQEETIFVTISKYHNFRDPITIESFPNSRRNFPLLLSGSSQMFMRITMSVGVCEFNLRFSGNKKDSRVTLPLVLTSPSSGYVATWGFENNRIHPCVMNASRTVQVPLNHVAMLSFSYVDIHYTPTYLCRAAYIQVYEIEDNGMLSLKMNICINSVTPALVLKSSFKVFFFTVICSGRGFKMSFSFHPFSEAPAKRDSGLWDCSVPHYNTFSQHLQCNLEHECQGGEDEGPHCPYSSPACNGSVAVGNKCFIPLRSTGYVTWSSASRQCRNRGGNLANVKTKQEQEALNNIYQFSKSPLDMHVGLSTYYGTLPPEYKNVLVWSDGTLAYDYAHLENYAQKNIDEPFCFVSALYYTQFVQESCVLQFNLGIPLCEFHIKMLIPRLPVLMPLVNSQHLTQSNNTLYVSCTAGHFTYDFLSCDQASHCGAQASSLHCQTWLGERSVLTAMFVCLDGSRTLPYSLVCDFRPDCPDGSDENFCKHESHCDGFMCRNGQCVELSKRCDVTKDCWDASDEECTSFQSWDMAAILPVDPPAVIDFDQQNALVFKALNISDACPDTHFRCPPDGYCLPVYVRCNGAYDCPYHEDEEDCASYTCPGFYRCRASSVCVHADHVCDGRPQCPQHDDELFCELTCPRGCLCQGLAFVCPAVFEMQKFPAMRYLDASGSGMATTHLSPSIHLVWLSLAACNLRVLSNMSLPSLQTLDLSDNLLTWLDLSYFAKFENLRVLRLAGNPLESVFTSSTPARSSLKHLDLSRTFLKVLEGEMFSNFPDIQVLNLSFVLLRNLSSDSFRYCTKLMELDMRGNDVKEIHSQTLRHLTSLRAAYVSHYTFCCKEFLPDIENLLCFSPTDSISSCQNLLSSKSLSIAVWVMCAASLAGNMCCAHYTLYTETGITGNAFTSLIMNLFISDMIMGVYLLVIGTVDQVYRARYLWYERSWTDGYVCQTAGFLYLVSTEVSALSLFLMSIERLFVIKFRASIFKSFSSPVFCCCIWVVSLVLAVLPFIVQRDLYKQNSVCAPSLVYDGGFSGWSYFSVLIAINLALSVTAHLSHAGSVCSLLASILSHTDHRQAGEKTLARRITHLLITKTLSLSFLTVNGLVMGKFYSVSLITSLGLLVGPLSASVNPVIYAVGVFREMRRKSQRLHLLKVVESRCHKSQDTSMSSHRTTCPSSKQ